MIFNKIFSRYESVLQTFLDIMDDWEKEPSGEKKAPQDHQFTENGIYERFFLLLEQKFPEDGFIVEDFPGRTARNEYAWVLDPIDGTSNMRTGVSFFSIVLSLVAYGSDLLLSFIMNPISREIYIAYGEENRLYSIKSHTYEVLERKPNLAMKEQEYVLVGRVFGHLKDPEKEVTERFRDSWWDLAALSKSYRQLGSIALQMLLDGWKRRVVVFSLQIRWFDVIAPLHFLKNFGYSFQVTTHGECLIVYHPEILPCEALGKVIDLAKEKWRFFPSNTFNIGR